MKVTQHKIINLLKTSFFAHQFFVSVCVFNVWSKTTLLPVWPRDAKRLESPCQQMDHPTFSIKGWIGIDVGSVGHMITVTIIFFCSDRFLLFLFLLSVLFCIGFKCTAQWLDNHTFYVVSPLIFPVPQLALDIVNGILWAVCPMLYLLPHDYYYLTTNLRVLVPLPVYSDPQRPPLGQPPVLSLSQLCLLSNFVLQILSISEIIWYLSVFD